MAILCTHFKQMHHFNGASFSLSQCYWHHLRFAKTQHIKHLCIINIFNGKLAQA